MSIPPFGHPNLLDTPFDPHATTSLELGSSMPIEKPGDTIRAPSTSFSPDLEWLDRNYNSEYHRAFGGAQSSADAAAQGAKIARLTQAANNGDGSASCALGYAYEKGLEGLPKDEKMAVTFYKQCEELGPLPLWRTQS